MVTKDSSPPKAGSPSSAGSRSRSQKASDRATAGQPRVRLKDLFEGPRRAVIRDLVVSTGSAVLAALGLSVWLAADETAARVVAAVLLAAALATVVVRKRGSILGSTKSGLLATYVSVRALLLVAVGSGYLLRRPDDRWWICAAASIALIAVLVEPAMKTALTTNAQRIAQLPGVPQMPKQPFAPGWLTIVSLGTIALGVLLAVLAAPGWLFLLLALLALPPLALLLHHAITSQTTAARIQRELPGALSRYGPTFAVYYAATQGARYQLGMWLPYLERLNRPFVVIARNPATVETIAELTSAPVLSPRTSDLLPSLDELVVPTLTAAFYVQGGSGNMTFQRYRRLTHVWLNHGDSDKQANYHQRHATFDKLFVAGQLGIDRYVDHGTVVPPEKFVTVGRPQIETIEVSDVPLPPGAPRTVLYAPTWKGGRPSTNYSSMPWGEEIVKALVRRGCTVLFRPHPLTWVDAEDSARARRIQELLAADAEASGRQHGWGRLTEQDWDIPACFNASDALITDVSSVATDYLASGKPLAMVATKGSAQDFRDHFAMARVAYVIDRDFARLDEVLDQLCGTDELRAQRMAYRTYCLGDQIGPGAADRFLQEAGRIVDGC
jgi:hypothetical protein